MHELHGDLLGHVFPGAAFILLGILWTLRLLRTDGVPTGELFSVVADPRLGPGGSIAAVPPLEGWLTLLIPLAAVGGELRWVDFPISDASLSNYQHITGYLAFSLAGLAALLVGRNRLPRGTDRFVLAFAFFISAFILGLHGHHMPVVVATHRLLAALMAAVSLLILVEWIRPAPIIRFAAIYVLLLCGAWFIHAGWQLYIAQYDLHGETVVVRTYLFFAWHATATGIVVLAILSMAQSRGRELLKRTTQTVS